MRRSQARKWKHSGKKAGNDLQPSWTTTPSITPTSSFIMDGSAKENKQVSLLIGYISMTDIINQRYQTPFITFIGFCQVLRKAPKQRRVIDFTNPIMAQRRLWGLQGRWGIISMVWSFLHEYLYPTHFIWAIFQVLLGISEYPHPTSSSSTVTSKIGSYMCCSCQRRRESHRVRLSFHPRSSVSW